MQQEAVYIGIDFSDSWTQISYFTPKMEEPETVSVVAGEERYRIPTALYKKQEFAPWYLASAERTGQQDGGICVDSLWERSLKGERIVLTEEYEARELLLLFLRKVLRLVPELTDFHCIEAVTFHLEEIDQKRAALLQELMGRLEIPRERVFIQDSKESFCHFAMNQKKELMQHDVLLFQCEEHQLFCYLLGKEEKTSPKKVEIEVIDLGTLPDQLEERDRSFTEKTRQALAGRIVSAVYLTGQGLEGGWLKESLTVLCRGRRVFQGKNLYTKGACYGSFMQMHKKECGYVYFSEYKLKHNIFVQVKQGNRTFFYDLAEAGSSCYEVGSSCQVLLEGEPCVDIWLKAPDSAEARIESLELTGLPSRPDKATRLKIEALTAGKAQVLIRISDLGFGPWYASSGKVWEYCIDE